MSDGVLRRDSDATPASIFGFFVNYVLKNFKQQRKLWLRLVFFRLFNFFFKLKWFLPQFQCCVISHKYSPGFWGCNRRPRGPQTRVIARCLYWVVQLFNQIKRMKIQFKVFINIRRNMQWLIWYRYALDALRFGSFFFILASKSRKEYSFI